MGAIPSHVSVPVKGYVQAELVVNSVIVFLVLAVVGLRVYARISRASLGVDDYLAIFTVPLGIGMLVCQGFLADTGGGYDLPDHPELAANLSFIMLMSYCMEIIYVLCLATTKASMLFFYRRIFSTPAMTKAVDIALGVLAAWTVCFECTCIFSCTPVNGFWTFQGKCNEFIPMIQSLITTNAIGDLIIMAMPMPLLWSLQMKLTDKIGVMSCFALGLACIVIAIFRVIYISEVDMTNNITGTMPTTILLFTLEPNLGILCVSIPMLRPLYAQVRSRNASARLYDYHGSDGLGGAGASGGSSGRRPGGALRTIGSISHVAGPGRRSRRDQAEDDTFATHTTLRDADWEMDSYSYSQSKRGSRVSVAGAGAGAEEAEDTGSEKALTRQSMRHSTRQSSRPPTNEIGVKTTWTVTRNQ